MRYEQLLKKYKEKHEARTRTPTINDKVSALFLYRITEASQFQRMNGADLNPAYSNMLFHVAPVLFVLLLYEISLARLCPHSPSCVYCNAYK